VTDHNEDVLRRSLDAVDRHRNRLLVGVVLAAVLLLLTFWHATAAIRTGNTNVLLHAVMLILGVWSTILALVVVIQITVMTKRILRAIELASKK
jgi:predicted transporter